MRAIWARFGTHGSQLAGAPRGSDAAALGSVSVRIGARHSLLLVSASLIGYLRTYCKAKVGVSHPKLKEVLQRPGDQFASKGTCGKCIANPMSRSCVAELSHPQAAGRGEPKREIAHVGLHVLEHLRTVFDRIS